jgi:hypothetical protein
MMLSRNRHASSVTSWQADADHAGDVLLDLGSVAARTDNPAPSDTPTSTGRLCDPRLA